MPKDPEEMDDEMYAWRLSKDTTVDPLWASHLREHPKSRANNGLRGPSAGDVEEQKSSPQNNVDGATDLPPRDDRSRTPAYSEEASPHSMLDHHHGQLYHHHRDDNIDSSKRLPESHGERRARSPVSLPSDLTDTSTIWSRNDPNDPDEDDGTVSDNTTAAVRLDNDIVPERQRQPYWGRRPDLHIAVEKDHTGSSTVYSVSDRQRLPYARDCRQDTTTAHTSQQQPTVFDYLEEEPPNAGLPPPTVREPWRDVRPHGKGDDGDVWSFTSRSSATVVELPGVFPAETPPSLYPRESVRTFSPREKEDQPHSPPAPPKVVNPPPSPSSSKTKNKKKDVHNSKQKGEQGDDVGGRGEGGSRNRHGEKKKEHKKDNWALRIARFTVT